MWPRPCCTLSTTIFSPACACPSMAAEPCMLVSKNCDLVAALARGGVSLEFRRIRLRQRQIQSAHYSVLLTKHEAYLGHKVPMATNRTHVWAIGPSLLFCCAAAGA